MRSVLHLIGACALALSAGASAKETRYDRAVRETGNLQVVLDNYPRASMLAGEEGTVGFTVELEEGGKLHSCVVTASSGYPRLDNETCELIVATARFKPVRDAKGDVVRSVHSGSIAWKLPAGYARNPPPPKAAGALAGEKLAEGKLICRRTLKAGSMYIKQKLCLTAEDWVRATENAQRETRRLQDPKAIGVF
jgi:TonB family protein